MKCLVIHSGDNSRQAFLNWNYLFLNLSFLVEIFTAEFMRKKIIQFHRIDVLHIKIGKTVKVRGTEWNKLELDLQSILISLRCCYLSSPGSSPSPKFFNLITYLNRKVKNLFNQLLHLCKFWDNHRILFLHCFEWF